MTLPTETLEKWARRGPFQVREREIPHHINDRPHIERTIYTKWIDPQLKAIAPVAVVASGAPEKEGQSWVKYLYIDKGDAECLAAAPTLAQEVLDLRAKLAEELTHYGDKSAMVSNHRDALAAKDAEIARLNHALARMTDTDLEKLARIPRSDSLPEGEG
jgi:aminopeptidase N